MRIAILTQYFPPETGAPQNRLGDLATRLQRRGHVVDIITAMPNYPSGVVDPAWKGRWTGRSDFDGATVLRSWILGSAGGGTARQLASYFSFVCSSAVTAPFRLKRADILLWESPPLFLAPVASMLARRLRAKLVMNVSDLWPQSAVELGMLKDPRLIRFFEGIERLAYRDADLVTCQTEGIVDGVRTSLPSAKAVLFPNGVDTAQFEPTEAPAELLEHLGPLPGPVVGYAGNFGRAQALEQLIDAAALVREERPDVTVLLVGDGPRRGELEALVDRLHLDNVRVLPSVSRADVPALLTRFDIAIVPLADRPIFEGARPSKMFELLSIGVPFVFCGRGEGAEIAERSGAAVVVQPEEPKELAAAILRLVDLSPGDRSAMGRAGRRLAVEGFDRDVITDRLEQELVVLVAHRD